MSRCIAIALPFRSPHKHLFLGSIVGYSLLLVVHEVTMLSLPGITAFYGPDSADCYLWHEANLTQGTWLWFKVDAVLAAIQVGLPPSSASSAS